MNNDPLQTRNMQIHERDLRNDERGSYINEAESQFNQAVEHNYAQQLDIVKRRYAYGAANEDTSLRQKKRKMPEEILRLLALRSISQDESFPGLDVYEIADIFNVKSGFARTTIIEMLKDGRLVEKKSLKGNRSGFTTPELYKAWEKLDSLDDLQKNTSENQSFDQPDLDHSQYKGTTTEDSNGNLDNKHIKLDYLDLEKEINKNREIITRAQKAIEHLEWVKSYFTETGHS
ncbi:MAG: hypothetical protein HC849_02330 [Oscillatoriales cyanobacterium RU_3_3]|nr:hypothetical protein [Oscillatoriales cyanobacterium RU_3_3]